MKRFLLFVIVVFATVFAYADTYFVSFADKTNCGYSLNHPEAFLSQRAIDRRNAANIAIDSLDLPVDANYVNSIKALGVKVLHASKWFNGITVSFNNNALLDSIQALPFVTSVERTLNDSYYSSSASKRIAKSPQLTTLDASSSQLFSQMNLQPLHSAGFRGAGKVVAIIDGGFPGVDNITPFDSVRSRVLGTRNYAYPGTSVYSTALIDHGTRVFSVMAGHKGDLRGNLCGTAPDASYYLFLTEITEAEARVEMDNWVAAVEYADSLGVDVVSTSLGYFYFDDETTDLSYSMMDGRSTRSSLAATLAAHRNMLIVNAVGNEGLSGWHYITTPSDAEDIIGVGAVGTSGSHTSFSSYGPSADGRVKPDLSALGEGVCLVDAYGQYTHSNGTSFACPALAGAATSLWSALPDLSALEIRDLLIQNASQYTNPDDEIGYGIPNIWAAYNNAIVGLENVEADALKAGFDNNDFYCHVSTSGNIQLLGVDGRMIECFHVEHGVSHRQFQNLSAGIYLLRFTDLEGNTTTTKLVKK